MKISYVSSVPLYLVLFAGTGILKTYGRECLETKCQGNPLALSEDLQVYDDACFALDVTDDDICDDSYEPRPIPGVVPHSPYNESWTYFTCCPRSYQGEVARHCDSTACSGRGRDCIHSMGHIDDDPMTCNDKVFKFPNIVDVEDTHVRYTCCDTDDGSLANYLSAGEPTTCDNAHCLTGDCAAEPIHCDDPKYKYPHFVAHHIPGSTFLLYTCCETDSYFTDTATGLRNENHVIDGAVEEECHENKCRGGIHDYSVLNSPSKNACWTQDMTEPKNCADGYEAYALPEVAPVEPYDDSWTYFTCCPLGWAGEVARKCDSKSCGSAGQDCVANGLDSVCDDSRFSHPVPILSGPFFDVYNCCEEDLVAPALQEADVNVDQSPLADSGGLSMSTIGNALVICAAITTMVSVLNI